MTLSKRTRSRPFNHLPILEPIDGTHAEVIKATQREEHRQSVNKAFGLVAKSLSPTNLRLFDEAAKPSCAHCVMQFFTEHYHAEMEQTNPRASLDLLANLKWIPGQTIEFTLH